MDDGVLQIKQDYFNWMVGIVCTNNTGGSSFNKLLEYLDNVEFRYRRINDGDRARDGVSLRHRFALRTRYYDYIMECIDDRNCSVLEMILALSIRCEEDIMNDPRMGDRVSQWFWRMINNLGLSGMTDRAFDERYVEEVVSKFLERKYEPDGRGGLFTIKYCSHDLRKVNIWTQMLWYIDTVLK